MALSYVKMNNPDDKYRIKKDFVPSLPFKMMIVGKSDVSGKTNGILNLLTRPFDDDDKEGYDFYANDFAIHNIYIICPQVNVDNKWIDYVRLSGIPKENVFDNYNERELEALYTRLKTNYMEAKEEGEDPVHSLIILDDCSASGSLKKKRNGVVARLICEARHFLVSTIATTQYLKDIPPSVRTGGQCLIFSRCSTFELGNLSKEFFYGDEGNLRLFKREFMKATEQPYSFMVIMLDQPPGMIYRDMHWQPIKALEHLSEPDLRGTVWK